MTSERTPQDPELLGSLLSAVRDLRSTEDEIEQQNAELASLSAALENERRRYERLFQRAPLAHLTTDYRGRISDANQAAADMLRVDHRYLLGKPLPAFVATQDRRRFRQWLLHPDPAEHPVFRLERRGSISFDAEMHIFYEDEETLAWVIRDVTEELRAERQMWDLNHELERRVTEQAGEIATVYDQLPVGLVIFRAAGTLPHLNPRAKEILEGAMPFRGLVDRALEGVETRGAIVRLARRDGDRMLEVNVTPLRSPSAEVQGAVVTFDDITERERIDRADREFVSNASHQLRTPVTAIASIAAALKAGAADDPTERTRFIDHLEAEAERLARIIDAMLVLARAQRKEVEAPLALVPLRPLLQRVMAEVKPVAGVRISCECDDGVAVVAHPALLEEALASGLANALEHTRDGTVSLTAERWVSGVVIEVADTGPGMEQEVRERAFERFFGSTPTRRSAGLGLAITAAAVEACRGKVELLSEPGQGTRLRILLPSAELLTP